MANIVFVGIFGDKGNSRGGGCGKGDTLHLQLCSGIKQLVMLHVYQESKVLEEVSA